jgi:hypothetical protein
MRFIFLVPDLSRSKVRQRINELLLECPPRPRTLLARALGDPRMSTSSVAGGTLNLMRHCWAARRAGADAMLATLSGKDTYGAEWSAHELPVIAWSERRRDDVCIVPDFVTDVINDLEGPAVAYLQIPTHLWKNFDYLDPRVTLWTDSPFMLECCRAKFPGKQIDIVPNVVDNDLFQFVPQESRTPGLLFAFPRKGPEFIEATRRAYQAAGGSYWRFELVDGLSIHELARRMREPQAFLASAEVEGCALPPQESMATGMVVVGKTARGANFVMEHRKTAMVAETPEAAAASLLEIEDPKLRSKISQNAYQAISRYFPDNEPATFWRENICRFESQLRLDAGRTKARQGGRRARFAR